MIKETTDNFHFKLKKAAASEYEAVVQLIQTVVKEMPNKAWFAADGADHTRMMLSLGEGTAYVAHCLETDEIAGVFLTVVPGDSPENLGNDIGLNENLHPLVVHMDVACVLPKYRGYGLQKKLMLHAEEIMKAKGYRYFCCTIHPENKYSLNSATALGYEIQTICEKYGGYLRAVLMKEI